jgi:hypothetical protein
MDPRIIEEQLIQKLTEGEMESEDTDAAVIKKLPTPTEIRIQAQVDPVVLETKLYRQMAKEVDGRYAKVDSLLSNTQKEE